MKKIIPSLLLLVSLSILLVANTFAWLSSITAVSPDVGGSVLTGYFADGDGSKEDPYILTDPIHVYNLAWLQYIGYFNDIENDGKIVQPYFKLNKDIDMGGIVLPPIGTAKEPFLGNFNGQNFTISNLIVSNYLGSDETGIEKRPLTVTNMDQTASIIGFFGVIGDIDGTLASKIVDDSATTEAAAKVNSVYNLFLDRIRVRTETDESLIGLLAGYVNGTVYNVGVGESRMEIKENVKPLSSLSAASATYAISLYSLIGAFDLSNVSWEELPAGAGIGGSTGEQGKGFGGSLNMVNLAKRLTFMYSANAYGEKNYPLTCYTPYATRGPSYDDGRFIYDSTSRVTAYLGDGTVLPLNVEEDEIFASTIINENGVSEANTRYNIYTGSGAATYPYYTTPWYRDNTAEPIATNNTGYIVGGGDETEEGYAWIRFKNSPLTSASSIIKKSVKTEAVEGSSQTKKVIDETMELVTIVPSADGKSAANYVIKDSAPIYEIKDEISDFYSPSNFRKYEDVLANYLKMMEDSEFLSGLRFQASARAGINVDDVIAGAATATITQAAEIYGKTIPTYEMIKGAVNFNLSNWGYITAIAGTYYNSSDHSLFTIFSLTRTNGIITAVNEIEQIWVKYNASDNTKFDDIKYDFEISSATDLTGYICAYDATLMNKLTVENAAYYFEIPVRNGDYAIGAKEQESSGAYLLYLDIGANGDIGPVIGGGVVGTYEHKIDGVTFVDDTAIANKTTDGYSLVTHRLTLANSAASSHTGATLSFDRKSKTELEYYYGGDETNLVFVSHKDDAALILKEVSAVHVNITSSAALMSYGKEEYY